MGGVNLVWDDSNLKLNESLFIHPLISSPLDNQVQLSWGWEATKPL